EAPGESQFALAGAGTPTALGVADGDLLDLLADRFRLLDGALLDLALGFDLQPVLDPARHMLLMPRDVNLLLLAPHHAARIGTMADTMRETEKRNRRAMKEWHRLMQLIETLFDPILVA